MNREGLLFLKGRSKEVIKRGGEQIWPNEIDAVVQSVKGVRTCVSFGIENEFWGEEVACAVVLNDAVLAAYDIDDTASLLLCHAAIRVNIQSQCKAMLPAIAEPKQIVFVKADQLPRTATGKFIRSDLAKILGLKAVDHTTRIKLQVQNGQRFYEPRVYITANDESITVLRSAATNFTVSNSLQGLRAILAMLVIIRHIGEFESKTILKVILNFYSLHLFKINLYVIPFFYCSYVVQCQQ